MSWYFVHPTFKCLFSVFWLDNVLCLIVCNPNNYKIVFHNRHCHNIFLDWHCEYNWIYISILHIRNIDVSLFVLLSLMGDVRCCSEACMQC